MNAITEYTKTDSTEKGFYPTPESLVEKMLNAVHWGAVSSMLEPSAGKGNIAVRAVKRWKDENTSFWRSDTPADMDCVELDPNLRAILKDQGLRVVHDDFMTYNTHKRYSLILMNPDFASAAKHILKAISLLEPNGQLVALCNAETIRNPYTNERNLLLRTLGNASIEFLPGAFLYAERKTDVETAMIVYQAPASDRRESLILDRLKPAHRYVDMTEQESAALTKSDFVEAIIDRYNYEVESGLSLIREYYAVSGMINDTNTPACAGITLKIGNSNGVSANEWVRAVRYKYWQMLFASPQFVEQLTSNLRQELYNKLSELQDYDFTEFNIREIMAQMNAQVSEGVESTIMSLFDDWTRKYHWDENADNRHYFDGWKTNDAFAVNAKVILPMNGYTRWTCCPDEFRAYNVRERLVDIEKVFNYLDCGRSVEISLNDALNEAEKTGQTRKVETKFFFLTFYKKGTCHIEFKDKDLLAKFNIFAARGKNWLPPSFGRKHYRDMDQEEKRVVDSFMGEATGRKYEQVVAHQDYFLATGSDVLNLTA